MQYIDYGKSAQDYWNRLKGNAQMQLKKLDTSLIDPSFDNVLDFVTEPFLTLNSLTARDYKKGQETLVSERDEHLICAIFGKEKLCPGTVKYATSDSPDLFALESCLINAERNKCDVNKYLSVKKARKSQSLNIENYVFCEKARILLTIKNCSLYSNAKAKKHSLYWLGTKTWPPKAFSLEDYWFYEKCTGVNLSVEIAALLDKFFEDHSIRIGKDMLEDLICFCIEENYPYIACIPATDWKIEVMKIACMAVLQELAEAIQTSEGPETSQLAKELMHTGVFGIRKRSSIFSDDPQTEEAFQAILKHKISNVFNQILCLFVVDALWVNIFAGNSTLSNLQLWLNTKHDAPIPRKDRPNAVYAFKWHPAFVGVYPDDEYLAKQTVEHEKYANKKLGISDTRKDVLIFCNNALAKQYFDILAKFVERNEIDGRIESDKICKTKFPRNKFDKRFKKIHQAVAYAIEASEKMDRT